MTGSTSSRRWRANAAPLRCSAQLVQPRRRQRSAVCVARVHDEERLDRRIAQLLEEIGPEAIRVVVVGGQLDDLETEAFEDRDLQVGRPASPWRSCRRG
ncbi:MAG: hypothetical protein ACR2HQ_09605 [Ilumatobacteraceae bacterium]